MFRSAMYVTLAQIARSSLETMEQAIEAFPSMNSDDARRQDARIDQAAMTAIVFAGMALEGFIYDYAAQNLSDSFVSKYLDKLDLKAKWVVVPRLVLGKQLDLGGKGLNLLGDLIRLRNGLVHPKSHDIGQIFMDAVDAAGPDDRIPTTLDADETASAMLFGDEETGIFAPGPIARRLYHEKLTKINVDYRAGARKAIMTLDELAKELDALAPMTFAFVRLGGSTSE